MFKQRRPADTALMVAALCLAATAHPLPLQPHRKPPRPGPPGKPGTKAKRRRGPGGQGSRKRR